MGDLLIGLGFLIGKQVEVGLAAFAVEVSVAFIVAIAVPGFGGGDRGAF